MFPGVTVVLEAARTSATARSCTARGSAERADRHERGGDGQRDRRGGLHRRRALLRAGGDADPAAQGGRRESGADREGRDATRCSRGRPRALRSTRRCPRGCTRRCAPSSRCARCHRRPSSRPQTTWHESRPDRRRRRTMRLQSYALGEWVDRHAARHDALHAVTGEEVAEATSEGLDFKAMLEYGRTVGGPALRAMTFHQRARMLKALAQYLMARKDEFYRVSAATGATKGDSWIDIDGGIGTFFAYASRGPTRVSRRDVLRRRRRRSRCRRAAPSSAGTSACRSRASPSTSTRSTSPCWGMLEKLAPTFLAGMPAIVKPATVTSLSHRSRRAAMVESGILPDGRVPAHLRQRRRPARSPRPARTPSPSPARPRRGASSRATPRSSSETVRFNQEADSLNFSHARPRRRAGHARSSISSSRKSRRR